MDFSRIRIKNLVFTVKDAIARNLANAADGKADSAAADATIALTAAQEAEITANAADDKADNAVSVANAIDGKATQALTTANNANDNATQALTTANNADGKATQALNNIPTAVSELTNDSGYVNSSQASNAAPVQSVVTKMGNVTLANIMGDVDSSGGTTSYPTACGRFAVTANIFSNMNPASYSGVLTIERRDSYQRHVFTSSNGEVYVGWRESFTIAEPTTWSKVYPTTYSSVSGSTVSVASSTDTVIKSVTLAPGIYIFSFGASFASNATGYRGIAISTTTAFSGAIYPGAQRVPAVSDSSIGTWLSCTTIYSLSASTTFYCIARQNSGSALNVTGAYRYIKLS